MSLSSNLNAVQIFSCFREKEIPLHVLLWLLGPLFCSQLSPHLKVYSSSFLLREQLSHDRIFQNLGLPCEIRHQEAVTIQEKIKDRKSSEI